MESEARLYKIVGRRPAGGITLSSLGPQRLRTDPNAHKCALD
eukprot:SAG11_NODE_27296_length_334_cov_0.876596_1_plen_41_part_10